MYDFAIAGAGPAGLAAAVTAAEAGRSVIVVEKGSQAGPEPRGESMPHHKLLDTLIRPDFLKEISGFVSGSRRFHSPEARKNCLIKVKEPYYFFEWRDLIDPLYQKAVDSGVEFIFDAEVNGIKTVKGKNSEQAAGLIYTKDGSELEIKASAVLGCGGRKCPVAAACGIDAKTIACPTVKFRGRLNNGLPESFKALKGGTDLQFFTVLPERLKSVEGFPPAFAYVFPLNDTHIEAGLMLRLSQFEKLKDVTMPDETSVMTAWEEAKNSLPGFSDFFSNTATEYEKLTSIQNRRFISENIYKDSGAVLLGDSIGFVDANGSAGLHYAMAQASGWAEMLVEAMEEGGDIWSHDKISEYYSRQNNWDFYKYIKGSFGLISVFERLIFRTFGTDKKLNAVWPLVSLMLKSAS